MRRLYVKDRSTTVSELNVPGRATGVAIVSSGLLELAATIVALLCTMATWVECYRNGKGQPQQLKKRAALELCVGDVRLLGSPRSYGRARWWVAAGVEVADAAVEPRRVVAAVEAVVAAGKRVQRAELAVAPRVGAERAERQVREKRG